MELWIRSQDKEQLIKADNVRIKHEYEQKKVNDNYGRTCAYINGKYRCSYIYTDSIWLGEYQTKERALEVLDEIQNILKPVIFVRKGNEEHILLGARQEGITSTLETEFKELSTYVYEMPLD